jgi:hypothetical protein
MLVFCRRRHSPVKLGDDAKFIKSEIFSTFGRFFKAFNHFWEGSFYVTNRIV